jgi:hypothetical protein
MGRLLPGVLEKTDPWSVEHWLETGWREGIMQAYFAPDAIKGAMAEFDEGEHETNLRIFEECIQETTKTGNVDISAAFTRYIARWNPYNLGNEEVSKLNPRILAASTMWEAISSVKRRRRGLL